MWKDYSNHTRKLIDVCQKNQYELTGNAPADTAPADVKELWSEHSFQDLVDDTDVLNRKHLLDDASLPNSSNVHAYPT